MPPSKYLGALTAEDRAKLEQRLASRQSSRCFICDDPLDLVLQKGQLDVDHIDPLAEDGLDAENNFALTHQSCNRSKGAANLQVARRIKEFERLQEQHRRKGSAEQISATYSRGMAEPLRLSGFWSMDNQQSSVCRRLAITLFRLCQFISIS